MLPILFMNKTLTKDISKVHPLAEQILLEFEPNVTKTASGLFLPVDTTDKNSRKYVGHIVEIGTTAAQRLTKDNGGETIKPGTRILFKGGRQYDLWATMNSSLPSDGLPTHCLVSWYDVLAVCDEDANITTA